MNERGHAEPFFRASFRTKGHRGVYDLPSSIFISRSYSRKTPEISRLGKTRQDRRTSVLANKRLRSFCSHYTHFLHNLCTAVHIPLAPLDDLKASKLPELIARCQECRVEEVLALVSPERPDGTFRTELFLPIMQEVMAACQQLYSIVQNKTFSSLDLATVLTQVSTTINESRYLFIDHHATWVLSWWVPQLLETLAILLLLSNSSTDGVEQTLTADNCPQEHMHYFAESTMLTVLLLSGAYLLDDPLLAPMMQPSPTEEAQARMADLTQRIEENGQLITALVRETSQADWLQENMNDLCPLPATQPPPREGAARDRGDGDEEEINPHSWQDIRNELSPALRRAIDLLSLLIPPELSLHLSVDSNLPHQGNLEDGHGPKMKQLAPSLASYLLLREEKQALPQIVSLSCTLDLLRAHWPVRFSPPRRVWLQRTVAFFHFQVREVVQEADMTSSAPEVWEMAALALEVLQDTAHLLTEMVAQESSSLVAQSRLGEVIVLLRFLGLTNKADQ